MKTLTKQTFFKQIARLIITSTVFIIFFGNGVHIHNVFEHLFHHGHTHVTLHVHTSDVHHPESDFPDLHTDDHHQHQVASIDLIATFQQIASKKALPENSFLALSVGGFFNSTLNNCPPKLLDLAPPDLVVAQYHSLTLSLRAPPTV